MHEAREGEQNSETKETKNKFPFDKSQVVEEKYQDQRQEKTIVEKKNLAKPFFYKKSIGRKGKMTHHQAPLWTQLRV